MYTAVVLSTISISVSTSPEKNRLLSELMAENGPVMT